MSEAILNVEIRENIMGTIVDVFSMMVAYSLGLHNAGFLFGIGYAGFDAWLVIWQRKRTTRWMTNLCSRFNGIPSLDANGTTYIGNLLWDKA
jgi:hypothetical protein